MTRAELRRMKKEARKGQAVYTLTQAQIEKIKNDAREEAVFYALALLFSIPVLIMRREYGWGVKRLTKFADYLTDYYFDFDKSKVDPEAYRQMVLNETGLSFEVLPEVVR